MHKVLFSLAVLLLLSLLSCSGDQDKQQKGAIDQQTEKVAQEAVRAIKTPLDQARLAVEQENNHSQKVEQQAGKQ
jgi:hypothetical protein